MTPAQTRAVAHAYRPADGREDEVRPGVRRGTLADLRAHAASVGIRVIEGGKAG